MAYAQGATLALEGNDPRLDHKEKGLSEKEDLELRTEPHHVVAPDGHKPSFAELLYYARLQRESEDDVLADAYASAPPKSAIKEFIAPSKSTGQKLREAMAVVDMKRLGATTIQDEERMQANRALRVAVWSAIFYLITTDILGPYSAPWAFAQLGYVPGCLMFLFLGVVAAYTGILLWWMFLHLDSDKYPTKTYSELVERVYGRLARHVVNILQCLQLLLNVAIIILGNGQGLSQVAKEKVCFSVLMVIWTVLGMVLGQIKTLQRFGHLANLAIWMNIFVLIVTMVVSAHSAPNYSATLSTPGPVITQAFISGPFKTKLVGIMQIVYSYGGAMLFIEFMSEMRRPFDFWKAMICAQVFIFVVYMFFGLFVYAQQGQFSVNPANQGISPYAWQTVGNVISLVAALIAAVLYGNIGLKVIYATIIEDIFHGPPLASRKGRYIWTAFVPLYWCIAFVVASAVPQFSNVSGFVAAVCIFQFTYTFPPVMILGFLMKKDAIQEDPLFDPSRPTLPPADSWRTWSRWRRAIGPVFGRLSFSNSFSIPFFDHMFLFKLFNFLLFLASLACAGLGAYSSLEGIIATFQFPGAAQSSFGCAYPVQVG